MYQVLSGKLWVFIIWLVLVSISLAIRPLFPIDETRYAAVAWEMWSRHDFLVPHLNGEAYSHKPPLFFWLIQLTWWLFGVNDWSLRLIAPLFSLATLSLSRPVALLLWPTRQTLADITPLLLLGSGGWMLYSTLTMFDIPLAFFVLLGIYSLLKLTSNYCRLFYWLLFALAIGSGVLTKGPVILLHLLPIALLAPWWLTGFSTTTIRWFYWYSFVLAAMLLGAAIALCWAIPAGLSGGTDYQKAIFLGQTSGRMVQSFAHQLPWWWYLKTLPLLLLPWLLIKPVWLGLRQFTINDAGLRFCFIWLLPVFLGFSLISGKRIHYLLPLIPAFILLLAWALDAITERIQWQHTLWPIIVLIGLLSLALTASPWLNNFTHWSDKLSHLSPLWGVVLLIGAGLLAISKINSLQDAVLLTCLASVSTLLILSLAFFAIDGERYDTRNTAEKIAHLMAENHPIAYYAYKYHGQYHFTGRLTQPITVLPELRQVYQWAKNNRTGYILIRYKKADMLLNKHLQYQQAFKGQTVGLLAATTLLRQPLLKKALTGLAKN